MGSLIPLINTLFVAGIWKIAVDTTSSVTSDSSHISTRHMQLIIEKLLGFKNKNLTTKMYLNVWRQFNRFVMSLDVRPKLWEDRTILFIGYLVDKGMQSTTVKSYVSAIKRMLVDDGYPWEDGKILLTSLTKACRIN